MIDRSLTGVVVLVSAVFVSPQFALNSRDFVLARSAYSLLEHFNGFL